jgi:hypothetical protein
MMFASALSQGIPTVHFCEGLVTWEGAQMKAVYGYVNFHHSEEREQDFVRVH